MLFATVPLAPPTRKTQRTPSCPAPISANEPYQRLSRLMLSAFWCVFSFSCSMRGGCQKAEAVVERDGDHPDHFCVNPPTKVAAKKPLADKEDIPLLPRPSRLPDKLFQRNELHDSTTKMPGTGIFGKMQPFSKFGVLSSAPSQALCESELAQPLLPCPAPQIPRA